MRQTDAAIAANRFGLGARPGELARLGDDPRGALAAQLQAGAPLLADALPSCQQLLARVFAQREAARAAREQGAAVQQVARLVREVYAPAYVDDVLARIRQAVRSEQSFLERLVHFWSNHFAVSIDKVAVLGLAGPMEREAIRPHVLGRFADLLLAVERHPAMLLYLDNQQSMGPNSAAARLARQRERETGLNENLGREILELHTLGVDGGYTQQDVRALATLISGWSVSGQGGAQQPAGEPGLFQFRAAFHEPGAQTLLGRRYAEGGVEQGEAALRDLAVHPATARHLATKLARHFVADDPPADLVKRVAAAYLSSDGDLPTTYRALLAAPESWRQPLSKFKTPADYLHSAWRALDLPMGTAQRDMRVFQDLGQRCFQPGSPAGWPDRSADWDGSAALMKRLEWAQQTGQRLGSRRDAARIAQDCLGANWSRASAQAVSRAQDASQALTLLFASPGFMRR